TKVVAEEMTDAVRSALASLKAFRDKMNAQVGSRTAEVDEMVLRSNTINLSIAGAAVLIVVLLSVFFVRSITSPMERAIVRLSQGSQIVGQSSQQVAQSGQELASGASE